MFSDVTVRAYERIQAPRRLLMGPWLHEFPAVSPTAPVDHLAEMCRWWDEWLRGDSTGIRDEPPVTLYVQGTSAWAQERDWPPATTKGVTLFLGGGASLEEHSPPSEESLPYRADPTVGFSAGHYYPGGAPLDQGPDDLRSLVFTTEPLTGPLVIAGTSEAVLHLAIEDAADANLVVKLCDVAPNGASTLITTGWLRASHRTSHEEPEQLEHLRVYEFRVPIWATAYEVAEGHRLRLAFSCSDFPRIWPTTHNPHVRVHVGGAQASYLQISTAVLSRAEVDPPSPGPALTSAWVRDGEADWVVHRTIGRNEISVEMGSRAVATTPGGHRVETEAKSTAIVEASRPETARSVSVSKVRLALPSGGEALIEARSHVTQYGVMMSGRVERDGQLVFEKQWLK